MSRINRKFITLIITAIFSLPAMVMAEAFVIKDIRVEGLQRISAGTVFNHIPVKIGERIQSEESSSIIRELYKTGFFKDVRLEREVDVLIVFVQERPAIANINISGNKSMETEGLLAGLKDIGLAEGRVFNNSVLDKIERELRRLYFSNGKYGIKLESTVTPLERNRVAVDITISEGVVAKIKRINIVGNTSFEEEDLLDEFKQTTGSLLSRVTKDDQYSRQKLSADLEILRSYYLDRGYINFKVDSTQVSISPDKSDIYITINITEGDVFTISDIKLAGRTAVPKEQIFPLIHLSRGDIFSRKNVVDSSERINSLLGKSGYAFANVNSIPEIDKKSRKVSITFFVDPGKRVYVRQVNFRGNSNTRDEVLRREMRQMESAWFSSEQIKLSKERLRRLGYFDSVTVETPPVTGSTDQVDVNVTVKEKQTGNLMAGIGWSKSDGVLFNTSISQDNFLGTGKRINFGFNNSSSSRHYQIGYTNPYYTVDGISRGFDLMYKQTDFGDVDTAAYKTDVASVGVNFGIPLNEFDRVRFAFRAVNTDFEAGSEASTEVNEFVTNNGDNFNDFLMTISWSHDSRDSALFPTRGGKQRLSAEVSFPGSDLEYYKVGYSHRRYFPISESLTLSMNGEIGYGDAYSDTSKLPFFKNYFAGGTKSIRGYKDYSLGPRDSMDDPLGGNMKLLGNIEVLFPEPFGLAPETVRMGAFLDFGNVYDTDDDSVDLGEMRYSTGLSMTWLSPMGALGFVLAMPLNDESDDETENFQFTFGSAF
ncbi:MAG: outer membrane protein assembly factor BamA [Gammaproteobacteria bacterium]|nr:outer membrane protein assembly factor BamA [Gammaproteobacteria bacterium]